MAADNLGFGASNPYLDKSIEDSLGDTTRQYNLQTAPAFTSASVRSGSFGNSGLLQAQQEAQRQLQTTQGRQANDMRSQNYQFDQNFDRGVYNDTFSQNQQNYQNSMNLLGTQSNFNSQDLGFGTQQQNTPLGYYQGFAGAANAAGGLGGSSSGNTGQNSTLYGNPIVGALGGAQLGNAFGKSFGFGGGRDFGTTGGYFGGGRTVPDYPGAEY